MFDLDGTLLDTMTLAPTAYADTIGSLGGPEVSPADIVATWHIGSTPVVLAYFLDRRASAEDIECFYRHFEAAVSTARPFPGVVQMLDTLSREGYRLASSPVPQGVPPPSCSAPRTSMPSSPP